MAVVESIRDMLPDGCVVFDNHAYDKSIVGVDTFGRAIYSYDKMIKEFAEDENVDELEAMEWVDYNTVRALSYMGDNRPIILMNLEEP